MMKPGPWFVQFVERYRARLDWWSRLRWQGSAHYWDTRYRSGGDSGGGSGGQIADYKARYLNALVAREGIRSVIEFGCGDGRQLALARYPEYHGLDVSVEVVARCQRQFAGDETKRFTLYKPAAHEVESTSDSADLAMSLDVLYHLIEDDVFEQHLQHLFGAARRLVAIYSSNHDATVAAHVRHRKFLPYIETQFPAFTLIDAPENPFPVERLGRAGTHAAFFVFEKRP